MILSRTPISSASVENLVVGGEPVMVELLQRPVPGFVFEAGRQAANAVSRFVYGDVVSGMDEIPGGSQSSRAGADDADLHIVHALPVILASIATDDCTAGRAILRCGLVGTLSCLSVAHSIAVDILRQTPTRARLEVQRTDMPFSKAKIGGRANHGGIVGAERQRRIKQRHFERCA